MGTRAARQSGLVLDRYTLHGEIASGGTATVHFGQVVGAQGFARTVAIKRLHAQFAKDPEFAAMFMDEARLAARIRHPNVVPTIDVVATAGELFLVMEYVAGESLAGLLRATSALGERVPSPIAARILVDALLGLHAAHEAADETGHPLDIVHRDISPHNILVGEDGSARVLDFGIARARVQSHATRDGVIKGKLRYMAPEQLRGATATRRADIYAASVVLWETLTGGRLFDGDSDAVVFGRVLEGVVQKPSALADVPSSLDAIVLRGLDRDAGLRFATAHEMATALEAAVRPATHIEVGQWVRKVAGPSLEARARRQREVELPSEPLSEPVSLRQRAADSDDRIVFDRISAAFDPMPTSTLTMPLAPVRLKTGARLRTSAIVAAYLALAASGVLAFRASSVKESRAWASRGLSEATRASTARITVSFKTSAGVTTGPQAAAAQPDPSASSREESQAARPSPTTAPSSKTVARSAHRTKPTCDPPTFVDAKGIRRVKRECL